MGYTTEFRGCLEFREEPDGKLVEYVNRFAESRRMKRDVGKLKAAYPGWAEDCLDGDPGVDGEFFVGASEFMGQDFGNPSILEPNAPPETQPGLWCHWVVRKGWEGRSILKWSGDEKFYNYVEWLEYLIDRVLAPRGCVLDGRMQWRGEDWDDTGTIVVTANKVEVV